MLFRLLFCIFLIVNVSSKEFHIDPNGYVVYCPCMGRFGNQVDQTLGVMTFARGLDRTLVLPNFIEFQHPKTNLIPFEHIFQLQAIKKFHRVITMNEFIKNIMPKLWPADQRRALCWSARASIYDQSLPHGCHPKEGNPFGPYWDKVGVTFVGDDYFGHLPGGYDTSYKGNRKAWLERYPASEYPVLAFSSAPAAFPSPMKLWENQRYLKWTSRITEAAKKFINGTLGRPFVGVHLRNDLDWVRVCEHINTETNRPLFASAQCLGENHHLGTLTKDICAPSQETVLNQITEQVGRTGAKSVFVASDRDHMIDEINEALRPYDAKAYKTEPDDPYVSLAILARSDMFIGNCVSTFSNIVKRERDYGTQISRPSTFFGIETPKRNFEL